jgi:hypothetical protein
MSKLEEIEAIKQLKYRYFRCLDTKRWDELGETLAEDATTAYDSGKYAFEGRAAIVAFLRDALGSARIISLHQGHHPEIDVTGPATARATWYLEDLVIFRDNGMELRGAGFYADEYVKVDGRWLIRATGYERTFEELRPIAAGGQLRTRFEPAE